MVDSGRPAVEDRPPPAAVLKILNPVVRAVVRSRVHRALSKHLLSRHVTGRKSARVYDVPVGRYQYNGRLVASAGGRWKANLARGAELDVTLDGRRRPAHAELLNEPQLVAEIFAALITELGPKRVNRLGMKINVDRMPTVDEVRAATTDRGIVLLTLVE